ncbi:hypothetical protein NBO_378g0011 [Nosema bombycis CQ1]|uniref:Uncharacterized protein n=1 Tax=Nosema bombycis (strain CQ1 / CVCC 102059) TaxID=578461 RepID=R0KPR5_NOSB1|nr:hypothetical protein NBO_378g0011 [Nosema bombycis CQ1]|eukprot:EOB12701.1 hypothetical protein NBO_378g0011 [Nosema bombycis CQ1]
MDEYEKINNEIKQLMNTSVTQGDCVKEDKNNVDHLIKILSDLIRVYKEIQNMLETNDHDGVKNKLLSDEIKISLVCESLMKVLKDECNEKKEIYQKLEEEKSKIIEMNKENDEMRHKIRKMESDIQYLSNGNKELNRIIQDQKSRVQSFKEKAELETKGADTIRMINKELENLKQKALDKNEILVKETNVLRGRLEEKDKTIRKLNEEIKNLGNLCKTKEEKCLTLEKTIIALRKKFEMKEEALDLCNSELAKLISKNKKIESLNEDFQGKAAYYERLYKAINKQNEYLNEQLARLINVDNADKLEEEKSAIINETLVTANSDIKKIKGYKKRLKKYKKRYATTHEEYEKNKNELKEVRRMIDRIKLENKRLQDEKDKAIESNNQVTDTLLNKVENLLEKNKEYQKILFELQEGKSEEGVNNGEGFKVGQDLSNKERYGQDFKNKFNYVPSSTSNGQESFRSTKDLDTMFNDIKLKNNDNDINDYENFDNGRKYQRSFRLKNDYEIEPINKKKTIEKFKEIENTIDTPSITPLKIPDNFYKSLVRQKDKKTDHFPYTNRIFPDLTQAVKQFYPSSSPVVTYNDFKLTDKESEEADVRSLDSNKSLQTTSTLKEMRRKTENLQNKFDDLEKQLEEIKKSDEPEPKKLHDQIKAYTDYYYSDSWIF